MRPLRTIWCGSIRCGKTTSLLRITASASLTIPTCLSLWSKDIPWLVSVSYTHLDVYKRQPKEGGPENHAAPAAQAQKETKIEREVIGHE